MNLRNTNSLGSVFLACLYRRHGSRSSVLVTDFDGTVAFADFLTLSSNFGQDGKKWSEGDFIANGRVEFDDFLTLSANFGQTASSVTQVPEPSTSLLAAFAILGLLGLRRRR